jgi:5'-nucleotidase / UDP-sugar diphosphatase
MKFKIRILMLVFLAILTISSADKPYHLVILHYNDFHGAILPQKVNADGKTMYKGGSSYIAGYIEKIRKEEENVLFLIAGDEFRGSPICDITKGKAMIELLNITKPDAFVLGNHEFDYSSDQLKDCIKMAQFPIVDANIEMTGFSSKNFNPYVIDDIHGVKVGIIGITTQYLESLTTTDKLKGVKVKEDLPSISEAYAKLKGKADIFIVLTHEDLRAIRDYAKSANYLDLIVAGHDHQVLNPPETLGNTMISEAGSKGAYIGRIDIYYDRDTHKIIDKKGTLIEVNSDTMQEEPKVKAKVDELKKILDKKFFEEIGYLDVSWSNPKKNVEFEAGNFEADVLRDYAKSEVAIVNSGSVRKAKAPGPITIYDMWEIFPFDDEAYLYKLDGKTIKQILEHNCTMKADILQFSGLRYTFDPLMPEGKRVQTVHIGTNSLEPDKIYDVCIVDYVANLPDQYLGIDTKNLEHKNLGAFGKKEMIEYIQQHHRIKTGIEGRIVDLSQKNKK